MNDEVSNSSDRARLFERAVSRWENEGGAVLAAGPMDSPSADTPSAAPLGSAEFLQLQFRVLALENLVTVLLAQSSDRQLGVVWDMAAHVAANPGITPHPPSVRAAAKMRRLLEGAGHLRALCTEQAMTTVTPADAGPA